MMLTACAASPQDLSGKMFTFPQETNTANVRLDISTKNLNNVTLCLRLGQLWFDGTFSVRKFISGSQITQPLLILGQEQDSYGGGFDSQQSFIGMMSDVHLWDYVLSSCEIQRYMYNLNFSPGNVLNWMVLTFDVTGR
ncbi:C-reactive protein-like [Anableps anableps]